MAVFGASPAQLTAAKGHVADAGQYIQGLRTSVTQTVEELNMSWHGPAARKFAEVLVGWNDEMRIVEDSLKDMAEKLGMNANVYAVVDEDARAAVGQIQSLINR